MRALSGAVAGAAGRRFLKRRIGLCRLEAFPELFGGDEPGADAFAVAPGQRTYPENLAARRECQAEYLGHRQRADLEGRAGIGNIDDQALDPWRVRRRNQKSLLVQIDPNPPARAEVFTGSRHRSPSRLQARVTGKNLCWENVNNLMDLARVNLQRSVARNATLIGARQPPHGKFDGAIRQFAPAFDGAHIGGLGIAGEEIARSGPRLVARQREGFAQIAVVQITTAGHPVGEIARAGGHVATPNTITTRSI